MSKLSWDYSGDEQRAEYRGFVIRAIHDTDSTDPIAEYDGHWPMIKGGNRDCKETVYDRAIGVPVDAPLDRFTDEQLVHDQKAIADALDTDPNTYAEYDRPEAKWHKNAEFLRTAFENAIGETNASSDKLSTFKELYDLLGIPCLETTATGYCQGDRANLLIVATPEAIKELRPDVTPDELVKDMQQQADLWEAWAFGNVWGYVIEDADGNEIEDGSCWGYYGDPDSEMSGLEESAIDAIDCHLDSVRRARQLKLKELIRNRVPVLYREALLREAA